MKKFANGLAALSLACLINVGPALAHENGELTEHVTFTQDVLVNQTLVKHGTYKLEFDPASGRLNIMDGKKLVASAPASLKVNEQKAESDRIYTHSTGMGDVLQAVWYGGQREEVVLSPAMSAGAAADDCSCASAMSVGHSDERVIPVASAMANDQDEYGAQPPVDD